MNDTHTITEPFYDFSTSCTKDDAVKYLLGWPRETISENWLPNPEDLELCDYTWKTLLTNNREGAETAYSNVKMERRLQEKEATGDALAKFDADIAEKLAELEKCDLEIKQAHHYLSLIDDELAKGDDSALRIDPTKNADDTYITLVSLDEWAGELNITIFDPQADQKELQDDGIQKGGLSKTKANNLQITFALLVKAFAETGPKFTKGNDYPNVNSIADHLENLAKNEAGRQSGQSKEAIKTRIEDAMKIFRDPPIKQNITYCF